MVPTPHIEAKSGEIAKSVLMPGDPLRAKFVAETFFDNPFEFNKVRGMLGYTGKYKGKDISVMGSGMGMPSMGIYAHELYNFYDVKNIIRIGTAGSLHSELKIKDIVIAQGACTNSNFASQYNLNGTFAPISSFELLKSAVEFADLADINYKVGNVLSSDTFYDDNDRGIENWIKMGVYCVEMETAALYMIAKRYNKNALGIFTISDSIITGESTTSKERQESFTKMMEIALDTAITNS